MEHIKTPLSHREMLRLKAKTDTNANVKKSKYRNANVQNWCEYLDTIKWDYFITGSTHYELTLNSARRLSERFHNNLPPKSKFFWVAERFECKDGYHIHGLVEASQKSPFLFDRMREGWQTVTGNKCIANDDGNLKWEIWNQIDLQPYMKGVGAHGYCAAYMMKKHGAYDFLC